jgi:hypothetical protein
MSRKNNSTGNSNSSQPTPQPSQASTAAPETPVTELPSENASVIMLRPEKGKRNDILEQRETAIAGRIAEKVQTLSEVRQRLAEAADRYAEGSSAEGEASKIADVAATRLFKARIEGLIDNNEVSSALGDVFGYKQKQDGTPSKTPAGNGEALRKRIVRAVQGWDYANGRTDLGGRFFQNLPVEEVADVVNSIGSENGITLLTSYNKFAEVKKDHMVKTNAAFDPKRISAWVETLGETDDEGRLVAARLLAENVTLQDAYLELIKIVRTVSIEAAEYKAKAAA